jgi:hypothetical protein
MTSSRNMTEQMEEKPCPTRRRHHGLEAAQGLQISCWQTFLERSGLVEAAVRDAS